MLTFKLSVCKLLDKLRLHKIRPELQNARIAFHSTQDHSLNSTDKENKLTGMCEGMELEVHLLKEAGAAHDAHIGLAVRVDLDVGVQVGDAVERLAALVAAVRLDCGVGQLVACQIARLTEGPAADVALEGLFSRVDSLHLHLHEY